MDGPMNSMTTGGKGDSRRAKMKATWMREGEN